MPRFARFFCLGFALAAAAPAVFANDISPWTPEQGGGEAEISYTRQEADEFYLGSTRSALPADLTQDNYSLSASYGLTQRLAADIKLGYANSDFPVVPGLAPNGGLDGWTDVIVGVRYKALDEIEGAPVTVTAGVSAIIEGDYEPGALPSIGDGGSGAQVAVALGRSFGRFAVSGDVGYRARSSNIPDEIFGAVNASFSPVSGVALYGGVSFVDSDEGLDVAGPGFTPARFPEVEEDYKLWSAGASAALNDRVSANIGYGEKFDGRNTARSNFVRIGLGIAF